MFGFDPGSDAGANIHRSEFLSATTHWARIRSRYVPLENDARTKYSRAGLRLFLVIEAKVTEDLCPHRIIGNDFRITVEHSTWLIKIDRPPHIRGNDMVILPRFRNAIDLDGEQDRNASFL